MDAALCFVSKYYVQHCVIQRGAVQRTIVQHRSRQGGWHQESGRRSGSLVPRNGGWRAAAWQVGRSYARTAATGLGPFQETKGQVRGVVERIVDTRGRR